MTPQPQATPPNKHGGLYLRALAFGIDNVLDAYRQCLVDIEKQVHSRYHMYKQL